MDMLIPAGEGSIRIDCVGEMAQCNTQWFVFGAVGAWSAVMLFGSNAQANMDWIGWDA
jgi:hypothetical protein